MTLDPQQRILRLVGGGNGVLYEARVDGELRRWVHTGWQAGTMTWTGPRVIGSGWNDYVELLADHNGGLYAVYGNGDIRRYRYVEASNSWEAGSGSVVATGWQRFPRVFGGPDGVLYGVDASGGLWRSQYANGAMSTPVQIGSEWQDCSWLGADAGGVIYGIAFGELRWWRYTSAGWVGGAPRFSTGDSSWDLRSTRAMVAGGQGMIYHIGLSQTSPPGVDGDLIADRLGNYLTALTDGAARWTYNGRLVGTDWTVERWASLQGYASPQSVTAGCTTRVAVSSPHKTLTASVWRHAPGASPTQVRAPVTIAGGIQPVQANYRSDGCGWTSSLDISVDPSWPSGVYSARVDGPGGMYRHIPFVVRPAAPSAPLAVILPTMTYHAYNAWAGHSQYTMSWPNSPRKLSLRRPSYTMLVEPSGMLDCDLYSDLLLLRWLSANGYAYDVYTDQDFATNLGLLGSYRSVVLGSHPEYVTQEMRQALLDYATSGGRLVYTGGNGLYEPVLYAPDAVTFRSPDGQRQEFYRQGLSTAPIVGTSFHDAVPRTISSFKVVNSHPILDGTGLAVGSVIGATGHNRGASGIEYDQADSAYTPASDVIARGQNPGGGGDMVFSERPGGFVFSASSLTFNGSLGSDAALSRLFRNVIDRAVAP